MWDSRKLIASFFLVLNFVGDSRQQSDYSSRVDCHPDDGATEQRCSDRGCIWEPLENPEDQPGVPFCYYPNNYGYEFRSGTFGADGIYMRFKRKEGIGSMFGNDAEYLNIDVEYQTDDR